MEKKYQGKRFYRYDFSKERDLTKADFRGASLIECIFDDIDLSYAMFDGANLYASSFKGACLNYASFRDATMVKCNLNAKSMVDVTITLNCNAISEAEISNDQFIYWLYMGVQMNGYDPALKEKVIDVIGPEKFQALDRMFKSQPE